MIHGAALKFSIDSTVGGTFYVYEKTKDKNGNDIVTQKQKITVKANKTSPAKLTTIYLEKGEYFVGMEGKLPSEKSKPEFSAYYNVLLTDTKYFENADGGWNNSCYALDADGKEDKTKLDPTLKAKSLALERSLTGAKIKLDDGTDDTDNWVGFSDAADYRMFTLDGKTNLTLSVSVTGTETGKGKAKLTIWKVSTGKGGKITLSSKGSITVKQNATGLIKSKVLDAGTYFVSVSSSDAKKGGDVSYSVKVDSASVFFDSADGDGVNKYVYDSKKKLNPHLDEFQTNNITVSGSKELFLDSNAIKQAGYSNFVGYNDKADYAKFSVAAKSDVTFTIDTTGSGTFAVYRINKDKSKLELVKRIEIKADAKTGKGREVLAVADLSVDEDYYISMTAKSTKANASGSVFYNVWVDAKLFGSVSDALAMPETADIADALTMQDALSFNQFNTDTLADASASAGAFFDATTERIFEEEGKGMLASL